ncbi:hypothetical protein [Nocardiopsis sp. MG754419]|uniref:hypothetical protein n=1 Tax=Nocardiopsis sp. MG754419 TaxID=2259865 RepID=UPI001BADBAA9|nr:hypothetical protein [Nocardiopsis sp. MG754419]MBR8742602.1 hypothetical protein [Nocardiopsis sp. MG754419]
MTPSHRASAPRSAVSAAVMTHPDRTAQAARIANATGLTHVTVATDPEPEGPPTALRSARVAFGAASAHDTDHHVVLQDDVRLADGFAASVERILAAHPEAPVSLFVEWGSRTAVLARWAVYTGVGAVPVVNPYVPTVALALPRALSVELGRFLEQEELAGLPDDRAVLRFMRERGITPLAAVPNPVEHEDHPSLVGNDEHGARRSVCFSAVERTGGVLDPPRALPFLRWNLGTPVLVDLDHDVPEAHRPLDAVLAGWGATHEDLATALKAHHGGLSGVIPEPYLTSVWHTAVADGAILETRWPGTVSALRSRTDEPAVERALASLVPGALRTFVDVDRLAEHRARVVAMTLGALEHGAEHCRVPPEEL